MAPRLPTARRSTPRTSLPLQITTTGAGRQRRAELPTRLQPRWPERARSALPQRITRRDRPRRASALPAPRKTEAHTTTPGKLQYLGHSASAWHAFTWNRTGYGKSNKPWAGRGTFKEIPSGQWDERTHSAMLRYQTDHGFAATGLPEAKSLMKLGLGSHPLPANLDPGIARADTPGAPQGISAAGSSDPLGADVPPERQ